MPKVMLDAHEKSTIENALCVAAEKFEENIKMLHAVKEDTAFMTVAGAQKCAVMFEQQAKDTRQILGKLQEADLIEAEMPEPEEDLVESRIAP